MIVGWPQSLILSLQTPAARYWYDITLGKSGVHLSNTMNTNDHSLSIRVYMNNKIAVKMYPYLESRREEIEQALGSQLIWNPNPENLDKTITLVLDTGLNNKEKVEEALTWMVENTVKFRELFSKIVREFKG